MALSFGDAEVLLVGTAHVSRESIREVERVIREEKPNVVCVELDAERYKSIAAKENWDGLDLAKIFREGKGFLLMANLVLSGFQRRMGNELGVKPGEEMLTAVETARELGIPFELADRQVQITLRRAWSRCGLWSKCKLLASLLSSALTTEKLSADEIEHLKTRGELDGMMKELAAWLPGVKDTLIDERDRYLAAKIWNAATTLRGGATTANGANGANGAAPADGGPGRKLVAAVVGAGHLAGIRENLEKFAARAAGTAEGTGEPGGPDAEISVLDRIPPPTIAGKLIPWLFPVVLVALVGMGVLSAGFSASVEMILRWLLLNGSLAALGTLVALGHPLSILAAFVGAPLGTLSPVISVGFFAALVEALLRRPRVTDTETLSADIGSLKGIYRNRITRALLVFFLSSVGGMIGNFISIPALAGLLAR